MAMRDEDFGAVLTPVEADDRLWSPPMATPTCGRRDRQSPYEEAHARAETERARAEAAEARVEVLLQAERAARSRAGSLRWQLDRSRTRLKAAAEETEEVRRAAKDALFHQAEVTRLEKLLAEAGVDSRKGVNARLHKALEQAQEQKGKIASLRGELSVLRKSERAAQASLSRESAKLRKALERTDRQKDTIEALRTELREAQKAMARLDKEVAQLGEEASTSTALVDAIEALRAENAALHKTARASESQCKWLDGKNTICAGR